MTKIIHLSVPAGGGHQWDNFIFAPRVTHSGSINTSWGISLCPSLLPKGEDWADSVYFDGKMRRYVRLTRNSPPFVLSKDSPVAALTSPQWSTGDFFEKIERKIRCTWFTLDKVTSKVSKEIAFTREDDKLILIGVRFYRKEVEDAVEYLLAKTEAEIGL